jgi:hypothetical protein
VDPKDAETAARRVELERVVKRFDRAHAIVKAIEDNDPPDELSVRLPLIRAQLASESGQRPQAVAALLAVPKDAPAYLDARLQAADILREDGKVAEAEKRSPRATSSRARAIAPTWSWRWRARSSTSARAIRPARRAASTRRSRDTPATRGSCSRSRRSRSGAGSGGAPSSSPTR